MRRFNALLQFSFRFHFWGSFAIVIFVSLVISTQIANRYQFASSKLHEDVIERWGAPIVQPVPSVRFVESGTVFSHLEAMPLTSQDVVVEAIMNYRKRGLAYFSGFDFSFRGTYEIRNDQGKTIDLVFVFPIQMSKNQVLLSDLDFRVDGELQSIDLVESADRLVWTGRLQDSEALDIRISFKGRGLDALTYLLDPSLPVRDFKLSFHILGGDHFDYDAGVVPATEIVTGKDRVTLTWEYASLESGVPVGVRLPSEKSFDDLLTTMIVRSWAPFLLFFVTLSGLALYLKRRLMFYDSYLVASVYSFFFVLLVYLAAYMHFYAAYLLSLSIIVGLLYFYLRKVLTERAGPYVLAACAAFLFLPTLAVILVGYTGLIYTLEILAGLSVILILTTRPFFRQLLEKLNVKSESETTLEMQGETAHVV